MEDFVARAESLKNMMVKSGVANADFIRGCSEQEISTLEKESNVVFPNSYKVFLKYFGHSFGGSVMNDIDILYDEISGLTNVFRNEILIEEGDPCLPDKAFVFSGRYKEQFLFFDASGLIKEPPIMYWYMDEQEFTEKGKSIFDILEAEIKYSIAIKNRREKLRNKRNT